MPFWIQKYYNCFIIRKERKCLKKCDIISEREIIDIDAFNPKRFTGSCVYHLFIYLCVYFSIYFHLFTFFLNKIIVVLKSTELMIKHFSLVNKIVVTSKIYFLKAAK